MDVVSAYQILDKSLPGRLDRKSSSLAFSPVENQLSTSLFLFPNMRNFSLLLTIHCLVISNRGFEQLFELGLILCSDEREPDTRNLIPAGGLGRWLGTTAVIERIRDLSRSLGSRSNWHSRALGKLNLRGLALRKISSHLRWLRGKLEARLWLRRLQLLLWRCSRVPRELRLQLLLPTRKPSSLGLQLGTSEGCELRDITGRLGSETRRLRLLRLWLLLAGGVLRVWLL